MISNTNKLRKTSGFTIVELLIVIVVIGILAAITIVAYNGVQARANTTKLDTTAKEIADKAEVYAADNNGLYPTLAQMTSTAAGGISEAGKTYTLSAGAQNAVDVAATALPADKIRVVICSTNAGITVTPYDYTIKAISTTKIRKTGAC